MSEKRTPLPPEARGLAVAMLLALAVIVVAFLVVAWWVLRGQGPGVGPETPSP